MRPVLMLSSAASTMRRLLTASDMWAREVEVFLDRAQEIGLLAIAEPLMIGLVLGVDELVRLHELVVPVDRAVVQPDAVGLRVAVDVVRRRRPWLRSGP